MAKSKIKTTDVLLGLGLLATVGYLDYATSYQLSFSAFYLVPILFVLRRLGRGYAFVMAMLAVLTWLAADLGSGERYLDFLTPIWDMGVLLSIFLLVIILFSTRDELRELVEQRTEKLRQEIHERTRLEKELLEIAEAEQRRIGQDLHDSLGQHLTATALAGKVLTKKLADKSLAEAAAAGRLVALTEEAIELTRKLARSLHPVELEANGLADALQQLAANISRAFNVSCCFTAAGPLEVVEVEARTQLFRIAQEAVSNAIRHGRARNIVISFEGLGKRRLLAITDDGVGLPPDARAKKGLGLRIMDYRARMVGATFDLQNLPAGGVRAVCVLNPAASSPENNYATEN